MKARSCSAVAISTVVFSAGPVVSSGVAVVVASGTGVVVPDVVAASVNEDVSVPGAAVVEGDNVVENAVVSLTAPPLQEVKRIIRDTSKKIKAFFIG
jgi:hypothetical protein